MFTGNGVDIPFPEPGGRRGNGLETRRGTRGHGKSIFNDGADSVDQNGGSTYRVLHRGNSLSSSSNAVENKEATLLAEKQKELERIVDSHDDLIRQLFHMENFTMMLSYDPLEAKTDKTAVFNEYKSNYDLIDQATPVAGPSRQTRGRRNEQRQMLSTASLSTLVVPRKRNAKARATREEILETLHSAKGKGKEKESIFEQETICPPTQVEFLQPVESISAPLPMVTHPKSNTFLHPRRTKRKVTESIISPVSPAIVLDPTISSNVVESTVIEPLPKKPRQKTSDKQPVALPIPFIETCLPNHENSSLAISKTDMNGFSHHTPESQSEKDFISTSLKTRNDIVEGPIPPSPQLPRIKIRPFALPSRALLPHPSPPRSIGVKPFEPQLISSQSSNKPGIKKIKLIVRRPLPFITNPKQRPQEPKFNSSIRNFLDSYINLDESDEDIDTSQFRELAKEEAEIWERVTRFKGQGRFISGMDIPFGSAPSQTSYMSPQRTTKDIWDEILEAVVAKGKTKQKRSLGRQVALQIATRIQTHFDGLESKKVKAREAEERRLRNLAKSTMKLVTAEWKKAVHHIRSKQREEQEAEERRLGHAHLDAILNQSGQLLETQQGDLTRGGLFGSRSRSGSIEDLDEDHTEDDEDEEGSDEEQDESEPEGDDRLPDTRSLVGSTHSGEEDEDDVATTALILPLASHPSFKPRSRSVTFTGSVYEDGSPAASISQLLTQDVVEEDAGSDDDLESIAVGSSQKSLSSSKTPGTIALENGYSPVPETLNANTSTSYASSGPSRGNTEDVEDPLPFTNITGVEDEQVEKDENVSTVHPTDSVMLDVNRQNGEGVEEIDEDDRQVDDSLVDPDLRIPEYLKPFAVAPVEWDPDAQITPPVLLRGVLRPYQQSGLEWLASLHTNRLNGILADEMGLGKTIQTIALLAHLACDRGIWGPHLIVVPTSVILNWEMEFKKFLPGFRVVSYHGNTKRRKELRQGWNDKHSFNVCITSYTLASRDAHIFKRKAWYYMILDEAHMIKNFRSQRWNILLMFKSFRRLLLTGTPLQNNLTELWALLQFLMSGSHFANLKEFGEWFSNPLERAIEMGTVLDDETMQRVSKLHTVLRPYLLRRLKRDVEKELPSKFEHLTLCPLSKRQRFLYDEFMSRAQTRNDLESGVYQKIANILMQLRKVCNHPDLFEVRPIVTSFSMSRSAIADFEITELLVRRRCLQGQDEQVDLDVIGLQFVNHQGVSLLNAVSTRALDATTYLPHYLESLGESPPYDTRTKDGYRKYTAHAERAKVIARWSHIGYLNKLRCSRIPIYSSEQLSVVQKMTNQIIPFSQLDARHNSSQHIIRVNKMVKSYIDRAHDCLDMINRFAFVTPAVIALDLPQVALSGYTSTIQSQPLDFDEFLHPISVKLQIAFPEPWLLQYDCGKLQRLANLLREKKAGGHRVLIFTQMTRILDILEIFLNFHGYLYLRLDGATKIEDRQYITERFNVDTRVFCFISSSRSGGVGINLTGADTVIFYDSDFNPQMDRQCEDRAHRIGQIRDVHIYRFVSQYTVEEAMLLKANQKRTLDDLVIQKGEFDWRSLFNDEIALTKALGDFEDEEDRNAAAMALREEHSLVGADEVDFGEGEVENTTVGGHRTETSTHRETGSALGMDEEGSDEDEAGQGGSIVEYMLAWVEEDYDYFWDWRL